MNQTPKKRLFFMCSPFFGYYKHIKTELELLGFEVDYYNDRPGEGQIRKGLVRLFPFLTCPSIVRYFRALNYKVRDRDYDIVLIINNKVLTVDFLLRLRKDHPRAYFVFYTWDSLLFYPSTINHISFFDVSYSFDKNDCEGIIGLSHLALFYSHNHRSVGDQLTEKDQNSYDYDILNVGTAHPNRYATLSKLLPFLLNCNFRLYSYLYIQPVRYAFNKLFVPEFKNAPMNDFRFEELHEDKMTDLFKSSKAILDTPFAGQSGLTIRTIEALGAKRKLITFNKNIESYDFYNKNNILILDESNWDQIEDFMKLEYMPIDNMIYEKYDITNWVKTLLKTWDPKDN